ncbi:VPLPA-CTERM sorting domain-containing protein [Hyphococcus sp.]|uniref:VPLPA-CTERM sorting domain-containing protein n=1 Tax=Hyphococcus sp. TaxID=2038636 RepID=UPI0020810650|nr:MAG: hypothetical protein DHS20C04_17540 [Marinicaulis sp.]
MKTLRYVAAAIVAAGFMAAPAGATTFVFKGDGLNVTPLGTAGVDFTEDCASTGDYCSTDAGLDYTRDSINLTVNAYANGQLTRLIQDVNPSDSGLGAWSEDDSSDDQTQFDSGESIEFIFEDEYTVTNVEFNAGGDTNCTNTSDGSGEGSCGSFQLQIFDLSNTMILDTMIDITNIDVLAVLGTGARFVLTALTPGSGFTVARFDVSDVPVPAALPLLLSGLAGLGFASRRRKAA